MDLERTTTIGKSADVLFALLADPGVVPEYAPIVTHVETVVEDGSPEALAAIPAQGLGEVRFVPDAATRRIEWGEPGSTYHGSITVEAGTASTADVTIRLHVRDDLDRAQVQAFLEEAVRGIRRVAATR
jgi:carbon monoxide dehydrogenase subunit G